MKRKIVVFASVLCAGAIASAQDCTSYNKTYSYIGTHANSLEHHTGSHSYHDSFGGKCSYSDPPVAGSLCNVHASATTTLTDKYDPEDLLNPLYTHYMGFATKNAYGDGNGAAVTVDTVGTFSVRSCLFSCTVTIGISGSGNGAGFSVSWPPDAIYNAPEDYYKTVCGVHKGPNIQTCDPSVCSPTSPIIIDTRKNGFHFTDPAKLCVRFDLKNDGHPGCYSWPKAGSGNAWLVRELDSGGVELFGNFTPHSDGDYYPAGIERPSPAQGFTALAWWDQGTQGGNGDNLLDVQDAVWPRLKLWIDLHCALNPGQVCTPLPAELHDLSEFGIHSLSLIYQESEKVDQWGNRFLFYAQLNPDQHNKQAPENANTEMHMVDVFLVSR